MISLLECTGGKPGAQVYQLEVVLGGTQPRIWRRLQVPGNANLGWLHAVIQVAVGWTNSHLHEFHIGGQICADPAYHPDRDESDFPMLNERKSILMRVAPIVGAEIGYQYDFGDSWEHRIIVEEILLPNATVATTARCIGGARACPPEDCGGVEGYRRLLKILRNPKHKEHESMQAWLGRPYDAETFEVAEVNTWLRQLKWPRVTESQLRKVLLARDAVQA